MSGKEREIINWKSEKRLNIFNDGTSASKKYNFQTYYFEIVFISKKSVTEY